MVGINGKYMTRMTLEGRVSGNGGDISKDLDDTFSTSN